MPPDVTASGGTLPGRRSRSVALPDQPGAIVEVGPFDGPGGPVLAPARLVVGDGDDPEVEESPSDANGQSGTRLPLGATANGRIAQPGEVDRYLVATRKGDRVRIRVRAASLGSWLGSVVTLRDASGRPIGENDDPDDRRTASDSLLDAEVPSDGDLRVEVTDRYGDGGPEDAYRLSVGPPRPDASVMLFGNPQSYRPPTPDDSAPPDPLVPEAWGGLNLTPAMRRPVRFVVIPEGRSGPIVVRALDLPPGVSARPVTIRPPGPPTSRGPSPLPNLPPLYGFLILDVAPDAAPGLGALRVVAEVRLEDGSTRTRLASATLYPSTTPVPFPTLPPIRTVMSLPVRVLTRIIH